MRINVPSAARLAAAGAIVATVGCAGPQGASGKHAPPDAIPPQVSIAGGDVTTGVALGHLRETHSVGGFRVARTPVTVAQYRRCVSDGACSPPSVSTGACAGAPRNYGASYTDDGTRDDVPVTCATPEQARAYCQWVGGDFPRIDQWLLAARGPKVAHFPWGDMPATCEQRQRINPFQADAEACCGVSCTDPRVLRVGAHPKGDSPLGVSDVLLVPEMVRGDARSPFAGCSDPGGVCTVSGLMPGAADYVTASGASKGQTSGAGAVGFRCAWPGGA